MKVTYIATLAAALACNFIGAPGNEVMIQCVALSGNLLASVMIDRDMPRGEIIEAIQATLEENFPGITFEVPDPAQLDSIVDGGNADPTVAVIGKRLWDLKARVGCYEPKYSFTMQSIPNSPTIKLDIDKLKIESNTVDLLSMKQLIMGLSIPEILEPWTPGSQAHEDGYIPTYSSVYDIPAYFSIYADHYYTCTKSGVQTKCVSYIFSIYLKYNPACECCNAFDCSCPGRPNTLFHDGIIPHTYKGPNPTVFKINITYPNCDTINPDFEKQAEAILCSPDVEMSDEYGHPEPGTPEDKKPGWITYVPLFDPLTKEISPKFWEALETMFALVE